MNINGEWNVFKRNVDNRIIQLSPSNGRYYLSCIRPDGEYVICQGGNFNDYLRIWRINLNSKEITCISPDNISGWTPSYSWSGNFIVFSSPNKSKNELIKIKDMPTFYSPKETIPMSICVCTDEGTNFRRLTSGEFMDVRPAFSPDMKRIAFISKRTGVWKLWEIDTQNNSTPAILDGDYNWAMRPWYSKDGNEIYFHTEINKKHTIVRYNRNNQKIIPLENDKIGNTHGAFTIRNENAILAHSNRSGNHGLWKFPLDGSSPAEIQIEQFKIKAHATMSIDGIITFDSPKE